MPGVDSKLCYELRGWLGLTDLWNLPEENNAADPKEQLKTFYKDDNAVFLISNFLRNSAEEKFLVLCIGTDKYIGDSLGPMVGTMLEKMNLACPVYGTLENPIHAINLRKQLTYLEYSYPRHQIIALDACLGSADSIGSIQLRNGCLFPGKGVGKKLPAVGDLSIVGIVDSCDNEEFFFMHNIRLNLIVKMAEIMSKGIFEALQEKTGSKKY